ncbi:MAG TPA: TetR/AcrR family transcriptional regulator [Ktedonobacterales bacterium]
MARKYTLQRRAQRQAETRQRIVEAAVTLHQTVGGARATISAIAELAGVERLTVYRHFPDELSLAIACTSHYQAANPPPDPEPWHRIADAEQRLRQGLTEVYAYHRRTEAMSTHAERDIEEHPVLREVLAPYFTYWEQVRDVLAAAWRLQSTADATRLRAAIGHAISFSTWRSLVREHGLEDGEAVELMVSMLRCLCSSRDELPPHK